MSDKHKLIHNYKLCLTTTLQVWLSGNPLYKVSQERIEEKPCTHLINKIRLWISCRICVLDRQWTCHYSSKVSIFSVSEKKQVAKFSLCCTSVSKGLQKTLRTPAEQQKNHNNIGSGVSSHTNVTFKSTLAKVETNIYCRLEEILCHTDSLASYQKIKVFQWINIKSLL